MSATSQVADARRRSGDPAAGRVADWQVTSLITLIPAALALAIGGYHIGNAPLWRDEAATLAISDRSLSQILATLPHDDAVHGVYYLVIHVVILMAGTSATALRVPSLIAMAVASAFTALVTRDLVRTADGPYPGLTGAAAGAVFAITPSTAGYAQEARSYAIVTALGMIATFLLLRALREGGRWWIGYGVAIALTGLFNLFGALIIVPHAVTLLIAKRRDLTTIGWRWLVAAGVGCVVMLPIVVLGWSQRGALGWMAKPAWWSNFVAYIHGATGTPELTWPLVALAVLGVAVELSSRRSLGPAAVAVPLFLLPPVVLLTVSQVRPMWDIRYVEFAVPGFAILLAWGMNALARLLARTPARAWRLAWIPLAVVPALLLAAFWSAQAQARTSRPDNLLAESRIIERNARPGDAIIYFPINDRIVSMPYPGPWRKLRDVALAQTPIASNTLYGVDVTPAQLPNRLAGVTRVWVVTSSEVNYFTTGRATPLDLAERAFLSNMHIIAQWRDGDTELVLYARS